MLTRGASNTPAVAVPSTAAGQKFQEQFPLLLEHLTQEKWEDNSPRTTSTLTVFFEDGVFKGCLNDRSASKSGWVSSGTLLDLLKAVESKLGASTLEWRTSRVQKKR